MLMICAFPHMYYTLQEMLKLLGAIIISHKLQEEANADSNENFFFQKNTHPLYIKSKQIGYLLAFAVDKEMATHSSILAWRIPGTEEPGRLLSMGRAESDTTEAT